MILHGDCIERMRELPDGSVDSIVTDPPYGLSQAPDIYEVLKHWVNGDDYKHRGGGFMGKTWDSFVPGPSVWKECFRVLKPGGHLLCFAGTRTQDLMAISLRMAGFEIRDMIAWVYGSGFPKSHNIGKAVDKLQGNERELLPPKQFADGTFQRKTARAGIYSDEKGQAEHTKGNSQWEGWGTALKPALEPITVARKPFKGTVAENVLKHGTGAVNIDGCRVDTQNTDDYGRSATRADGTMNPGIWGNGSGFKQNPHQQGRFPANLIHDGSDQVMALFPQTTSEVGSAARFFYCAKASKRDRDEGLEGFEEKHISTLNDYVKPSEGRTAKKNGGLKRNHHPTVKPTALM